MIPLRDTIPTREFPVATWMIIILNSIVFFIEISLPEKSLTAIFYHFGVVPARYSDPLWAVSHGLTQGNYLPFLTNMFLHGGWMHFISNMWTLYLFGDNVEDRMGHVRFFVFYILSGLAASLTHYFFNMDSTVPAIGASGAIAGVMGAYFILFPHSRVITLIPILFLPYFIEIPAFVYLWVWFISQLFSGTFSILAPEAGGGIAWWAHIGGFVAGILMLPLFKKRKGLYRRYYPDELYQDVYF